MTDLQYPNDHSIKCFNSFDTAIHTADTEKRNNHAMYRRFAVFCQYYGAVSIDRKHRD